MKLWQAVLHVPFDYYGDSVMIHMLVKGVVENGTVLTQRSSRCPWVSWTSTTFPRLILCIPPLDCRTKLLQPRSCSRFQSLLLADVPSHHGHRVVGPAPGWEYLALGPWFWPTLCVPALSLFACNWALFPIRLLLVASHDLAGSLRLPRSWSIHWARFWRTAGPRYSLVGIHGRFDWSPHWWRRRLLRLLRMLFRTCRRAFRLVVVASLGPCRECQHSYRHHHCVDGSCPFTVVRLQHGSRQQSRWWTGTRRWPNFLV